MEKTITERYEDGKEDEDDGTVVDNESVVFESKSSLQGAFNSEGDFFNADEVRACNLFSCMVYDGNFQLLNSCRLDLKKLNELEIRQRAAINGVFGIKIPLQKELNSKQGKNMTKKYERLKNYFTYPNSYMEDWVDRERMPPSWVYGYEVQWVFSTFNDLHLTIFVSRELSSVIVAFRGSNSIVNGLTDIQAFQMKEILEPEKDVVFGVTEKTTFFLHHGFFSHYRDNLHVKLLEYLTKVIQRNFEETTVKVIMTGHSLGGAMASIAALSMKRLLDVPSVKIEVGCISFASPCIGDNAFAKFYRENIPESRTLRFVNLGDGIPSLWFAGTVMFDCLCFNRFPLCPKYSYEHVTPNYIRANPGLAEDCSYCSACTLSILALELGFFFSCFLTTIMFGGITYLHHSTETYTVNIERLLRVKPNFSYSFCGSVSGARGAPIPIEYGEVDFPGFSKREIVCCYEEDVYDRRHLFVDSCLSCGICYCCFTETCHRVTRPLFYCVSDKIN